MYSKSYPVRLTQQNVESIQKAFVEIFMSSDHLWIFGSRTDLNKRGGDIDLYIETEFTSQEAFDKKIKFAVLLINTIGDQKIDIVVKYKDAADTDIYMEAKKTGILLV